LLASTPRRPQSVRLALNPLESREVPSATTLNLTSHGSTAEANGAIFRQSGGHSWHTRSFLAVKNNGSEQGYNTDARPLEFDEHKNKKVTRSLEVGQVPVVTIDGVKYREFLLNTNQHFWSPYLTLTNLQLYVSSSDTLKGYNAAAKKLGGQAPVFDLDAGGDVSVKLNARLNFWGRWDVRVLVPDAAFAGRADTDNVYLFSKFSGGNGGFEQWLVRKKTCQPPEPPQPTTGSISGLVFLDTSGDGRQATGEAIIEEPGIEGVQITLRGTNDLGEEVMLTTYTDSDGAYKFENLRPGTYEIVESQPEGWDDGLESPDGGSLGGTVGDDQYSNIQLTAANMNGTGYTFGEQEPQQNW
jgi:hypothetical protein